MRVLSYAEQDAERFIRDVQIRTNAVNLAHNLLGGATDRVERLIPMAKTIEAYIRGEIQENAHIPPLHTTGTPS